jgi:hypothetical protein
MRPRKSHRRGNDALPRGLYPENEATRGSLGRIPRNSQADRGGSRQSGRTPGFAAEDGPRRGTRGRNPGRWAG